jgi:hypothetical protein
MYCILVAQARGSSLQHPDLAGGTIISSSSPAQAAAGLLPVRHGFRHLGAAQPRRVHHRKPLPPRTRQTTPGLRARDFLNATTA